MEKFKTLNNHRVRQILHCACASQTRAVYMMLFNSRELFTNDLFTRVYYILFDMCPFTLDIYKSLPLEVQQYYNTLWQNSR